MLTREASALSLLKDTDIVAPALVAVDPTGVQCEYPSLLMTYLSGRAILDDQGLEARSPSVGLAGVIDWAGTSWGPADLDVAHCCTNLALIHGPAWGLRFVDAYQKAGGLLAATSGDRLYWGTKIMSPHRARKGSAIADRATSSKQNASDVVGFRGGPRPAGRHRGRGQGCGLRRWRRWPP